MRPPKMTCLSFPSSSHFPRRHTMYICCVLFACFLPSNSKVPITLRVFDDRLPLQLTQHHSSGIFCSPSVRRSCWYAPEWNRYLWPCQWREWYEKLRQSGRCTLHFANPMLQPPSKLEAICLSGRQKNSRMMSKMLLTYNDRDLNPLSYHFQINSTPRMHHAQHTELNAG